MSREQFEAWWEINYHNGKPPRFGWAAWRDGDGYKIDDDESELDGMWNAWQAATNALEAKCSALAADNARMDAFVDALLSIAWQGGSADGAEIQDLALKHGLLRQEVYSADEHETLVDDPGNFEDGDPVYFRVETAATDSHLAEVRAQGVDVAISELNQLADRSEKEAPIATEHHRSAALYLQLFAAQLRQEAAQ